MSAGAFRVNDGGAVSECCCRRIKLDRYIAVTRFGVTA